MAFLPEVERISEPPRGAVELRELMSRRLDVSPDRLALDLIVGGRSNMTWRVDVDGQPVQVLRHAPLGNTVQGGHDVVREARIMQALAGTGVPVPDIVDIVEPGPLDVPIVVSSYLDGGVLRNPAIVEALVPPAQRSALAQNLMDVLVRIHDVDPATLPIRTSSRGIAERQLERWLEQSRREQCSELGVIESTHGLLAARMPSAEEVRIIHGDYRLENCLIDQDGVSIQAVLDWELTTLGDPLADVGLLLAYWAQVGDSARALHDPPTVAPGFPRRDDLVSWYLDATGRNESALRYYEALGWWKLACIVGGVHARIRRGIFLPPDRTEASYAEQAKALAYEARERAAALTL